MVRRVQLGFDTGYFVKFANGRKINESNIIRLQGSIRQVANFLFGN